MDTSECEIEYDQRHMRHESTLTRSNILYKERGDTGEKGKYEQAFRFCSAKLQIFLKFKFSLSKMEKI